MSSRHRKKLKSEKLNKKHMSDGKQSDGHEQHPSNKCVSAKIEVSGCIDLAQPQGAIDEGKSSKEESTAYKYFTHSYEQRSLSITRASAIIAACYLAFTIGIFW